jgi:acyl carrier protein
LGGDNNKKLTFNKIIKEKVMDIQQFIADFEQQFAEPKSGIIKPDTEFKKVDGWDSLTAMCVIDMVSEKYGVTLSGEDIRTSGSVLDLFNKVNVA